MFHGLAGPTSIATTWMELIFYGQFSRASGITAGPMLSSEEQRDALERFVAPVSIDWRICNEIANQQKHVKRQTRAGASPFVNNVTVRPHGKGFHVPPSMRVFGAGEDIVIDCDGNEESALAFVVRTFGHFHYIFEVAPIPPAQRDVGRTRPSVFSA